MAKFQQKIQLMMALVLLVSLFAPASMLEYSNTAGQQTKVRIQPVLAQIAAESPDEIVRIIVQKADDTDQAERLVERLGGKILKDLELINAFAAELAAKDISKLAQFSGVNWASLDAEVVSTGKPVPMSTYTLLDRFDSVAYDNNDGIADWKTPWIEQDALNQNLIAYSYEVSGDPFAGNITIVDGIFGELYLDDNPNTGTQPSIAREANLYGVANATLSFSYRIGPGTEAGQDIAVLEISSDGGETFTILETFDMGYTGNYFWNASHDISTYISDAVRIRFRISSAYGGTDEYFAVDNVQISYQSSVLTPNTFLDTLNVRSVWNLGYTGTGVGIAVIDSGISPSRDLNISRSISFNSNSTTVNDVNGHGTHVAGIASGNGNGSDGTYMGIAPNAHLIGLKISDESGMAYESDTVDAMEWVLNNKDQYNIRVVNLSIQSTLMASYNDSPVDAAAEILWFNGIVVVASAGNGFSPNFNPVMAAPANDPFIITVGASDEKGTVKTRDDVVASFSAWGITQDGYLKPEIFAPGKDIISVLSKSSDWDDLYPERAVLGGEYFRISGTSMSAPMVTGAAALLLQAEPDLTPDQVKYRLINTGGWVGSWRYLDIYAAVTGTSTESANQDTIPHQLLAQMAMIAYWANAEGEEHIDWENVDWATVNWNAVNWNAVNWNAVNWNAVNWNAVNWNAVNWNAVNWNAVNWNAVNWNAVNWNAVNWNAVNWNSVYWFNEK